MSMPDKLTAFVDLFKWSLLRENSKLRLDHLNY